MSGNGPTKHSLNSRRPWFFIPQQPGAAPEKWPPGKDDYDHLSNLAEEAIKASIELHALSSLRMRSRNDSPETPP